MNWSRAKTPTAASVQEQIDRLEEEPLPDPEDSTWEVVRHAVAELRRRNARQV
jgi:hypothetical protein